MRFVMAAGYGAPPCNSRRNACGLHAVCVEFACSLRYKGGVERKEGCVLSETLIVFPPFRLDVLNEQL